MSMNVSVVSACYNHGKYIHEMLDSVLNQTFQDFEVIIVNDGSTDDTKEILDKIRNEKVKIFHTEHLGPAHARNYAIQRSKGDIIMNLDADDKIAPSFLKKCIQIMKTNKNVGIVYSEVEFFDAKSGLFELKEATIQNMLYGNQIVVNACFRRSDWDKTEGYSDMLIHGLEDYDFWLSLIELDRDIWKINEPLVFYRTYADASESRSGKRKSDQTKVYLEMIRVFRRHENLYKKYPAIWGYFLTIENKLYLHLKSVKPELINKYFRSPTFSIITPTCKRPLLLKSAIESVLGQSFTDFEQIIIDDANDPKSAKIVSEFNSKKLRYFAHDKQQGVAGARNTGIKIASGKFICFLDDDDIFLPDILQHLYEAFKADNELEFVWTGISRLEKKGNLEIEYRRNAWPKNFKDHQQGLAIASSIATSFGLCIKKRCFDKIGLFDEDLKFGEDTDLMIRLAGSCKFATVPKVLIKIYKHEGKQLTDKRYHIDNYHIYSKIIKKHYEFLSKYPKVIHMHTKALVKICYRLRMKNQGRKMYLKLILKYPLYWLFYADLLCYELYGIHYEEWKSKRKILKNY